VEHDDRTQFPEHVEAELFSYLTGELSPEVRDRVEEHLRNCSFCRAELAETRHLVAALEKNRAAFCPAPSELYEYARSRNDSSGTLEAHIQECEICRAELAEYANAAKREVLPKELWLKIRDRVRPTTERTFEAHSEQDEKPPWLERIFGSFKATAALAAAVAVALLVFLIVPPEVPDLFVGLTATPWEQVPKPKTAEDMKKDRLAFVLLFRHFDKPVSQALIDSSYKALSPDIDVVEQYEVMDPSTISRSLKKSAKKPLAQDEMLQTLGADAGARLAASITVTKVTDGYEVDGALIDIPSTKVVKSRPRIYSAQDKLDTTLRELSKELLMK